MSPRARKSQTQRGNEPAGEQASREGPQICPTCNGTGRIGEQTMQDIGRRGGNISYLKSQEPGQESMAERGRRGGRNRLPTWSELKRELEEMQEGP